MSSHPPAGWIRTDLGSVTTEEGDRVGSGPPPVVLSSTKHHGLVPSEEFFKGRTIYSANLSNYKAVRRDWFAYATNHLAEGSVGLQTRFDAACVSPIYTVFSCRDSVEPTFLFRVLKSPAAIGAFQVHEQASVDRRGAVRYRDFARVVVDLPPRSEQRRISQILDTVDDAICSTERLIAKLEHAKRGLLNDLLTRGLHDSGELRDPFLHPEDFSETPLGVFPKAFTVRRVDELLARRPKNGHSPPEAESWTGTWMLGLGCLTSSGFAPRQLKLAPPNDPQLIPALLHEGDLLMSRSNTREMVGLVGRYRDVGAPCTYPDLMMRLVPTEEVSTAFLELVLRSHTSRRRIQSMASGTSGSMVKIGSATVMRLQVAIPTRDEQERIVAGFSVFGEGIDREAANLRKLLGLRSGLVDDLLTGRVRVTVDEDAA
jgi:type I restriction enzyme S subunit